MTVDITSFSENELKIIAALAFDGEPATLPELSVATRLKPSVAKQVIKNLFNKQVLDEFEIGYKLRKNNSQSPMKNGDYISLLDLS